MSDTVPPRNKRGLRTGYTTGSNAAAAAKAATIALLTGQWPPQVTITLPIGETATMTPICVAPSGLRPLGKIPCCCLP